MFIQLCQQSLRAEDGLVKMAKFKCNGCKRETQFMWLGEFQTAEGFRVYQCLDCQCVGTKNMAEAIDRDGDVSRCDSCGSWQFAGKKCHTCLLIDFK